ncbi:MAG: diacylglycerol kinase family lipid kinase [Candidatus Cloacimonetes bacterium]|nr:diacylglycerol kinase family lipid kinase [Candidatus Cloacimonadota bacterium]
MQNEKWFFIVNAIAGIGKTGRLLSRFITILNDHKLDFDIEITKAPKHATKLALDAVNNGYTRIAAVGGDGTVNEVVNGIMLSQRSDEVTFGIIPEGGGNDFARNFDIPNFVGKAVSTLEKHNTTKVDVCKIEDYYFINSLGIGFDARVAEYACKAKYLNGLPRYLFAVLKALVKLKPYKMKISLDNKNIESSFLMITIGNGRYCGGGFKLTPNSIANDGKFDICLIDAITRRRLLRVLPKAIKGTHIELPEVKIERSDSIEIKTDQEIPVYFDGELPVLKNPKNFRIELLPKKINLIC